MARKLVLMGSGENSPAMVTPHQNILRGFNKDAKRINLDTPYGFQENADELTARILGYFEKNVGSPIEDIKLRNLKDDYKEALNQIDKADWIFSGPGSPTYALRVWSESGVGEKLKSLLNRGSVVMASAAAMTLGSEVVPVYEMYKVGADPHWLKGLNLLEYATGINATVIAHYNNNQGGTHDTRFCFVGGKRMAILEDLLPAETGILGIDEHTGISFDLESGNFEVFGKGSVTARRKGVDRGYPSKSTGRTSELF